MQLKSFPTFGDEITEETEIYISTGLENLVTSVNSIGFDLDVAEFVTK